MEYQVEINNVTYSTEVTQTNYTAEISMVQYEVTVTNSNPYAGSVDLDCGTF